MSFVDKQQNLNFVVQFAENPRWQVTPTEKLLLQKIMLHESDGATYADSNRQDGNTTMGIFSLSDEERNNYKKRHHIKGEIDKFDPETNCRIMLETMREYTGSLGKFLGREPTSGEAYLSYFVGPNGVKTVLSAPDDDASIYTVMSRKAIHANKDIPFHGKPLSKWTVGDLKAWAESVMDGSNDRADEIAPVPVKLSKGVTLDEIKTEVDKFKAFQVRHDQHQTGQHEEAREIEARHKFFEKKLRFDHERLDKMTDQFLGGILSDDAIAKLDQTVNALSAQDGKQANPKLPFQNMDNQDYAMNTSYNEGQLSGRGLKNKIPKDIGK